MVFSSFFSLHLKPKSQMFAHCMLKKYNFMARFLNVLNNKLSCYI